MKQLIVVMLLLWTIYIDYPMANVRSLPKFGNNIIGQVYEGQYFEVLSFNGVWYEIDFYGQTGYLFFTTVKQN